MRILLDTNVLVRATKRATGPAREILRYFASESHVLVLSGFMLTELVRVLNYDRLVAQHGLSLDERQEFVRGLEQLAEIVELPAVLPSAAISFDPDDDPVLATALAGRVEIICSLDRHLLHANVRKWCEQHGGMRVLTDAELLRMLRDATDAGS